MRIIAMLFLTFMALGTRAQDVNRILFDEMADQDILYGYCTLETFKAPPFNSWFNHEYNAFEPNPAVIEKLNKKLDGVSIRIILGTWYEDSRREFPRFMKIFSQLENNERLGLEIICVNRSKTAVEIGIAAGSVQFVPTFIVLKNGEQRGRIVESPQSTLEDDLLNLLQ